MVSALQRFSPSAVFSLVYCLRIDPPHLLICSLFWARAQSSEGHTRYLVVHVFQPFCRSWAQAVMAHWRNSRARVYTWKIPVRIEQSVSHQTTGESSGKMSTGRVDVHAWTCTRWMIPYVIPYDQVHQYSAFLVLCF